MEYFLNVSITKEMKFIVLLFHSISFVIRRNEVFYSQGNAKKLKDTLTLINSLKSQTTML